MSRYRRNPDGTFDKVAGSPYMPPNFIGASPSENGAAGLVPAPLAGDEGKVLYGDGSWRTPPSGNSESDVVASLTADGVLTYGDILNALFTQAGSFNHNKEYVLTWIAGDSRDIYHAVLVADNVAFFSRFLNDTNNTRVTTAVVGSTSKISEAVIDSNGYTYNDTTNDVPTSGITFFIKEI